MNPIIRRGTRRDERQLFALARAAPNLRPIEFSTFRHLFESILADLSSVLAVAEVNERLVGYLHGHRYNTFHAAGYVATVDDAAFHPRPATTIAMVERCLS